VRLQGRLADRPEVTGWVQKPGDFAEASTPEVSPPESAAKSNISKRQAAQGPNDEVLERHKDKRHASFEAMRELKVRKSHARARTRIFKASVRLPQCCRCCSTTRTRATTSKAGCLSRGFKPVVPSQNTTKATQANRICLIWPVVVFYASTLSSLRLLPGRGHVNQPGYGDSGHRRLGPS
jgi:hypothetical protein